MILRRRAAFLLEIRNEPDPSRSRLGADGVLIGFSYDQG